MATVSVASGPVAQEKSATQIILDKAKGNYDKAKRLEYPRFSLYPHTNFTTLNVRSTDCELFTLYNFFILSFY